jgi:TMEM151 family
MGESAVVDKETGRIFWEGGSSSTLAESIAPKLKSIMGIPHLKATVLTAFLLFGAAGSMAEALRALLQALFGDMPRPFCQTAILSFTRTILLLPKLPRWFVAVTGMLYLTEAYMCSTRTYLMHPVSDVGAYIEQLRETPPVVQWKVRSFHYENVFAPALNRILLLSDEDKQRVPSQPSILRWKRVTHTASGHYSYNSCEDETIAGVWKRAVLQQRRAPFTKIVLTKTLLLRDAKAREDYFRQQRAFLATEHSDDFAEFSTSVQILGFQPRVLAVYSATRLFFRQSMFWIFTFAGLTVPYRTWFAAQCDEVRVRVVKETGTDPVKSGGWFSTSKKTESPFQSMMQLLYTPDHRNETVALVEEGLEAAAIVALEKNATPSTDTSALQVDKVDTLLDKTEK